MTLQCAIFHKLDPPGSPSFVIKFECQMENDAHPLTRIEQKCWFCCSLWRRELQYSD